MIKSPKCNIKMDTYNFLGVEIKSPLIVASCPLTESVERLINCDTAGAGGAILKTAADYVQKDIYEMRSVIFDNDKKSYYASSSFDREILTKDEGIKLFIEANKHTDLLIIPSVTAASLDAEEWLSICRDFEAYGAKIIQLDFFYVGTQIGSDGFSYDLNIMLSKLKKELKCELMPKLNINLPADFICPLLSAVGVKGVSLLDSIRVPYFNSSVESNAVSLNPNMTSYFGSWQLPLTLSYTYAAKKAGLEVCAGGGIMHRSDLDALLLMGAKVVQVASVVMLNGYAKIENLLQNGYDINGYSKSSRCITENKNINKKANVTASLCKNCRKCLTSIWCSALKCNDKPYIDTENCEGCGWCSQICDHGAIKLL